MKIIITTVAVFALLLTTSIIMGGNRFNNEEENEHEKQEYKSYSSHNLDVAAVNNANYTEECGSCHFAYQPGLLPEKSWLRIMADLENHFDENAELEADTQKELIQYLLQNSANKSNYKRSKRIMRSLGSSDVPLRITKTLYFIRKHDEIPFSIVKNTKEIGSFSNCTACHINAEKGSFNEHDVKIPGYGRWED
jgi:hypothetical protein